jgi:predicted DNA-binding transcriptional regulator AlpA
LSKTSLRWLLNSLAGRTERELLAGWLTVDQVCEELQVSRRTFDRWRARRTGPRCVRLGGNGPVRIKRCWLEDWIDESGPDTT